MISRARTLHRLLSRDYGHWAAKRRRKYACPVWADRDAYTHAFLKTAGIIRA